MGPHGSWDPNGARSKGEGERVMRKKINRKPMGKKKSRKLFTRTAKKVHAKNSYAGPMRGGIRL